MKLANKTKQDIKIFSFSKQGLELKPIQVEMNFVPGLPQFQIIGLPDALIKESQIKIKSALQSQGFKLPQSHKVIVNLRPSYIKKVSQGLDLAIAINYLLKSEQIQPPKNTNHIYLYGELGLDGSIKTPDDLTCLVNNPEPNINIYTGFCKTPQKHNIHSLHFLTDFENPKFILKAPPIHNHQKPPVKEVFLKEQAYRLACIIATGEHSCLMSGSAGSGKTTLAQAIHQILQNPSHQMYEDIQKLNALFNYNCKWRPLVSPHHTTPPLSLIGGGSPPFPGEITRSHGGILLLDEFLEFNGSVLETLREPIESKKITVARRGKKLTYPAHFLLLATTNLCPCGKYSPKKNINCRYSLKKCRSYLEKLSGPLVDRFSILSFSHQWKGEYKFSTLKAQEEVNKAFEFIKRRNQNIKNSELDSAEIKESINEFTRKNLLPQLPESFRRQKAFFQVARSIADLDRSIDIKLRHLNESFKLTVEPFLALEDCF